MADIDYSRVLFGLTNLADSATLQMAVDQVVGSATANPLSNLQHPSLLRTARSNGHGRVQIAIDFGSAVDVDVLALIRTNLTSTCSVEFQTGGAISTGATFPRYWDLSSGVEDWPSGAWDGHDYDPPQPIEDGLLGQIKRTNLFRLRPWAVSRRYALITIQDDDCPDDFFECARLFIGKAVQPAAGLSYNYEQQWIDQTIANSVSGGRMLRTRRFLPYRRATLNFDGITEADAALLAEAFEAGAGVAGADVLLVPFPDDVSKWHHHSLWTRMMEASPTVLSDYNWRTKSYKFDERMD